MAIDPAKTVQQHDTEPMSEVFGATAKLARDLTGLDLIGANADVVYMTYRGAPATLTNVDVTIGGTIDAPATVTVSIGGTNPSGPAPAFPAGVLTIPSVGSLAGNIYSAAPDTDTAIADGDQISLTVGGTNTLAIFADVSIAMTYAPEASL